MAEIVKPNDVTVKFTRDEVRVIIRGLRALRTYEMGDEDVSIGLLAELDDA